MAALDGYFNLPTVDYIPLSACAILVGAPVLIAFSFVKPTPSAPWNKFPKFLRLSPWFLGMLWLVAGWVALSPHIVK